MRESSAGKGQGQSTRPTHATPLPCTQLCLVSPCYQRLSRQRQRSETAGAGRFIRITHAFHTFNYFRFFPHQGAFATTAIARDSTFHIESPLLFATLSRSHCCMCGRQLSPPLTPTYCQTCIDQGGMAPEVYCSLACREAAWNSHHQRQCADHRRGITDLSFMAKFDRCEALYLLLAAIARGKSDHTTLETLRTAARSPVADAGLEQIIGATQAADWCQYVRDVLDRVLYAAGEPQPCAQCGCREVRRFSGLVPDQQPAAPAAPAPGLGLHPESGPLKCDCRWQWYRDLRRVLSANAFPVHSHPPSQTSSLKIGCCLAADAKSGPQQPAGIADGLALYSHARYFNHSCVPNAAVAAHAKGDPWSPGATLHVVALCDIAAGEEITIAYTDAAYLENTPDHAARRQLLRESFGFDCLCEACSGGGAASAVMVGRRRPSLVV